MFLVVTYDVMDDRRRVKVASELENFGQRVQFSVFECHLTASQRDELRRRLNGLLCPEEDRVGYHVLCTRDVARIVVDGPGMVMKDRDYLIV